MTYTLNFTVTLFGADREDLDRAAEKLQEALTHAFDNDVIGLGEEPPHVKLLIGQNTVSVIRAR